MKKPGQTARLFNKTELFLTGLGLAQVDLGAVAQTVAQVLGLEPGRVLVVDARGDLITLDILQPQVDLERIVGKEPDLLAALGALPGLEVTERTRVHSEGVLGMIGREVRPDQDWSARLDQMESGLAQGIASRCLVLPTGDEVIAGAIRDTNTGYLVEALGQAGFAAQAGAPPLPDDLDVVVGRLLEAAMQGFGLVVTTGGTGAESKDCMVEAIEKLDPQAATAYTAHYTKGQGRHAKDGVRLGVGRVDLTTLVALTGPHQEVVQVTPTLIQGLHEGWSRPRLAHTMADILRANFQPRHHHG